MFDDPPAHLLIAVVREALESGLAPGFAQKMAANALGIAHRELTLGPGFAAAENAALARLTAAAPDTARDAMQQRLCAMIADGAVALDDPALVDHLVRISLARVAVDQPGYPGFRAMTRDS